MKNNLNNVAIVGRPNVGKSTLFNRLIRQKLSIMSDVPGTTRDRLIFSCKWIGKSFNLIDTGGFSKSTKIAFQPEINEQVEIALDQAQIIIILISSKEGITSEDRMIAQKLKQNHSMKHIILGVNKADNLNLVHQSSIYYKLGLGEPIPISSIHGIGISNLLDKIISLTTNKLEKNISETRIGIIGKPNVGKSTLVNKLLNDNRNIVSEVPGTTRDSIDSYIKVNDKVYTLTDTAGIKKNKKALTDIEWYAELRTNMTIQNSDIILLMIDVTQGITHIDENILEALKQNEKPTVVLVNKSDLLDLSKRKSYEIELRQKFKFAGYVIIEFISALEGKAIKNIFVRVNQIEDELKKKVSKPMLNSFLIDIQMLKTPPTQKNKKIKLTYITYVLKRNVPNFIIFTNYPELIHFSYKRFIENQIRALFGFDGIPIRITFKKK